jgi:F-type H+-transporting ATPase subunit epsilon
MASFQFNLISPEKILFDQAVEMVVVPGIQGDIGVLPQHAPLVTLLRAGVITIYEENKSVIKIFVDGGFAELTPDKCTALVTSGISLEALDKHALEIEIKNLLEDTGRDLTAEEQKKANKSLAIAQAKLMAVLSPPR